LLLQDLQSVAAAAHRHEPAALGQAVSDASLTAAEQARAAKGVANYLTDDESVRSAITDATTRANDALRVVLENVRDSLDDSEAVQQSCMAVHALNEQIRNAIHRLVNAEQVTDQSGREVATQASRELARAAEVIERAAQSLLEAKRRAEQNARAAGPSAVAYVASCARCAAVRGLAH